MRVCSRLAVDEEVVGLAVAHDGEDDDGGHDGEHPAHLRESFPISHKRSLFEFKLNSDCERV